MLNFSDLNKMARGRVEDAKVLFAAQRFDGCAYIAGYAIEFKLKARIGTSLLSSRAFPETNDEFESLARLKSHRIEELLRLSGRRKSSLFVTGAPGALVIFCGDVEARTTISAGWKRDCAAGTGYNCRSRKTLEGIVISLVDHVRQLHSALRDKYGPFALFALLLPDEGNGLWDLVLSADWLTGSLADYEKIAREMKPFLSSADMAAVARIAILPRETPLLFKGSGGSALDLPIEEAHDIMFNGWSIRHAFVFEFTAAPKRTRFTNGRSKGLNKKHRTSSKVHQS